MIELPEQKLKKNGLKCLHIADISSQLYLLLLLLVFFLQLVIIITIYYNFGVTYCQYCQLLLLFKTKSNTILFVNTVQRALNNDYQSSKSRATELSFNKHLSISLLLKY